VLKNNTAVLTIANTFILIIFLGFYIMKDSQPEVVYIDKVKLFDGFRMTVEMKKVGEKEFANRKTAIDALYAQLNAAVDSKQKMRILDDISLAKQDLEKFSATFASEESNKIWTRINSYTATFSTNQNYKMIIGTEGWRTVLYGDKSLDKTSELLSFINKKYEGNE